MDAQRIADNLRRVQDGIADACAASNRKVDEVTLIAVTKFVPMERIAYALERGVKHVGENRVQEFQEKQEFFENYGCTKHFIGQLQTNKVKYIMGQVDLVQSVDRPALVQEMDKQAAKKNLTQDILIEVNIGSEEQKGGILEAELPAFLEAIAELKTLRVKGLMCIPPALDEEEARPYFARMRELFEKCKAVRGISMEQLSMGMSGDYRAAVEEGATMVRVGSALFGGRA